MIIETHKGKPTGKFELLGCQISWLAVPEAHTYLIKYADADMHERFGEINDLLSQIADSKRSQSQICFLNMHGKLRCISQVQLWLTIIDERLSMNSYYILKENLYDWELCAKTTWGHKSK